MQVLMKLRHQLIHNLVCHKHSNKITSLFFKFTDTCTSPSDAAVASNSSSQPLLPQGIYTFYIPYKMIYWRE